jgi:hypothetical protein
MSEIEKKHSTHFTPWEKHNYCGREGSILHSERFSQGVDFILVTNLVKLFNRCNYLVNWLLLVIGKQQ